jgi:acetylglutamate kinase
LLTDVAGVMSKTGELISSLTVDETNRAIEDGTIAGGMIPKLESCLGALESEVEKAHIIDGRIENSLILELFTQRGIGTEIVTG